MTYGQMPSHVLKGVIDDEHLTDLRIRNEARAKERMSERIDISGKIGPLYGQVAGEKPEWPMYSYERPAYRLWNAIANEMYVRGYSLTEIKDWLQSTSPRHALDGSLGDLIDKLGAQYAAERFQSKAEGK